MEIQDDHEEDQEHLMADSSRSNQNSTQIMDVKEIASSIREKFSQTYRLPSSSRHCSIFRVPNMLRRHSEKAFMPEVVSIGPFHHENTQLQAMEIIKQHYLECLIYRAGTTELECLVKAIQSIEQDCRECYSEVVDLSSKKFIEMMLIDGCFILEFLYRYQCIYVERDEEPRHEILIELKDGEDNDPVFKTSWMPRKIIADLLLLENQLPWCVLDCLFNRIKSTGAYLSIPAVESLVDAPFLEFRMFRMRNGNPPNGTHKHLLDCFRAQLVESCTIKLPQLRGCADRWEKALQWKPISSVTELSDYKVYFFRARDGGSILDVMFEDGKMRIPEIVIEEDTESLFRNLIAFENCDPSMGTQVTSYATLLACLIRSPADALLLKKKHILQICLSNEDDTASFLKRLIYNNHTCIHHGFLYSDLRRDLNLFQSRAREIYKATLRRDYNLRDPTTFITVVYGIAFSLFLGILQTIFAILSYFK
ncbi:hypothetical protein I3843_Q065000 [Carya illinoinensis]|nr:hypothetical protein I3843_Q065000 [Carya illinoinensis]